MKSQYRVVVIGGGVVGASVLYHLAKLGWQDVVLIERSELTAGSSWHAAGGFHALNADPNIASLQNYTIKLYQELEAESGENMGLQMSGGINLATTAERWEQLQAAWAVYQTMGMTQVRLITPGEIAEKAPIVNLAGVLGGLYDPNEGYLDTTGTVRAYAAAARKLGAEIVLRNPVRELRPHREGGWTVVTEQGEVIAEHVINAGGLWARKVGQMAGVNLPVAPLQHHYLVTEPLAEVKALTQKLPFVIDLDGGTYLRREVDGLLLGIYEDDAKHWHIEGAPWDYGMDLIAEETDRIATELAQGFERFPCLKTAGVRRWVNGPFTFTPDGNPLVGPVPGLHNYWVACGVMAGFAQGGGVGLALAQWMIQGEPEVDVFGMDVARYGDFAAEDQYLAETTAQFYRRRFKVSYPNEQLPAGRPLRKSPTHDTLAQQGARWGISWGLEVPIYFAPQEFEEIPTQKRSNAFPHIAAECRATRETVGMVDITGFARYEVSGVGAAAWLNHLLASKLPAPERARLAPMLSPSGRLLGDLTLLHWPDEKFWLMGSYYLRQWHLRWFHDQLPGDGSVTVRDISDQLVGWAISGPLARDLLASVTDGDVANASMPFLTCQKLTVAGIPAWVNRMSVTGELGYEINVLAKDHARMHESLMRAGEKHGLVQTGFNAMNSLRMEKSFGIWSREFTWAYTPGMSGLDRFIDFAKGDFIGRESALQEREQNPPQQRLVTLAVDAVDADASGFEPVWQGEKRVGFVTSGAYGHCVEQSLAMAYLDVDAIHSGTGLDVHIVGQRRPAKLLDAPPHDPTGARMRG